MCRYEDDFEWYVDSENTNAVSDNDEKCEDCRRVIPAGETHTLFTVTDGGEDDYSDLVWIAMQPVEGRPPYYVSGRPYTVINEDIADVFEALGYDVDEVRDSELHPPEPVYRLSCNHCRAADIWLQEVCSQTTVLVAVMDLQSHWYEYSAEQLGPDFGTLYKLSTQQWRSKLTGELLPVPVIERLAKNAARFAVVSGITDDH